MSLANVSSMCNLLYIQPSEGSISFAAAAIKSVGMRLFHWQLDTSAFEAITIYLIIVIASWFALFAKCIRFDKESFHTYTQRFTNKF